MPEFDSINKQEYYIDVFNRGTESLEYSITSNQEWITLSGTGGTLQTNEKVFVSIDWEKAPLSNTAGEIIISGANQSHVIQVPIRQVNSEVVGSVENEGVITIDASKFSGFNNGTSARWITVPNLGRTSSSITIEPANAEPVIPDENAPTLEYTFSLFEQTELTVHTYLSPTLNFKKNEGLKFAISIDDGAPQIINMHEGEVVADWNYPAWWNNSVSDHIKVKVSEHGEVGAGVHTLKIWMVDPGVVIQQFVIDTGGLKPSYLGPKESKVVE